MSIYLISSLSLNECIARLNGSKSKEVVSLGGDFNPLYCDVNGNTFTLRKDYTRFVPYMYGELSEIREGTAIACSMKVDSVAQKLDRLWYFGIVPIISCFALVFLMDGIMDDFSKESIVAFLLVGTIPVFYFLQRKISARKSEQNRLEILEFLQKMLDAKPRKS